MLSNSARNSPNSRRTPHPLAISSAKGAEIGAASSIGACGPRISVTIGWSATHPSTNLKEGSVEAAGRRAVAMQATPQERRNEQPRCLAFPPVEKPQNRDRNQGEQARQEKSDKKHEGDFRRHPNEEDDLNQRRICQHQQQGCADRKACSATAHGRAHQEAIISGMCDQDRAISLPSVA